MRRTKKLILECRFQKAIQFEAEYIAVAIGFKDQKENEIIINARENFESKLSYYQKSYDDDLKLKSCADINIVSAVSFSGDKTAKEIFDLLEKYKL